MEKLKQMLKLGTGMDWQIEGQSLVLMSPTGVRLVKIDTWAGLCVGERMLGGYGCADGMSSLVSAINHPDE